MTSPRRNFRPQRKPIFVGCEGESEQSYIKLIGLICDARGLHVALRNDPLGRGAGDPLAKIELAIQKITTYQSQGVKFAHKFVLLDADKLIECPERAARSTVLARRHNIHIVWQEPCFEAFLLRHLPECERLRPPDKEALEAVMRRVWPEYEKPMPTNKLLGRIDMNGLERAAAVEFEFKHMLECIGLISH